MSRAESGRAAGCIAYRAQHACAHEPDQQIPIAEAVRVIQGALQKEEDRINAAIRAGRCFYVHNKIHTVDCPTVRATLQPTTSWRWVTESDDPDVIEARYGDILYDRVDGFDFTVERLHTRDGVARSTLKLCMTCAPDVIPRVATKRPKKVSGLGASDLGRLLDGQPIESITHEPGVVIVRTAQNSHRFDSAAAVVLDPAPSAATTPTRTEQGRQASGV
ncbi:hypothetical protein IU449_27830 [Nocardia higoensis]|uniref:Uncharacterized protein n=1 Tax=Nocardia higoensis TaxID=228599 RepID=A0ABS0DIM4_9NOCA|nr:hypothetical protein [Nocardia higoensis]MBF6358313.1 hypothetical protein [Nocardia higoensis]